MRIPLSVFYNLRAIHIWNEINLQVYGFYPICCELEMKELWICICYGNEINLRTHEHNEHELSIRMFQKKWCYVCAWMYDVLNRNLPDLKSFIDACSFTKKEE